MCTTRQTSYAKMLINSSLSREKEGKRAPFPGHPLPFGTKLQITEKKKQKIPIKFSKHPLIELELPFFSSPLHPLELTRGRGRRRRKSDHIRGAFHRRRKKRRKFPAKEERKYCLLTFNLVRYIH